MAKSIANLSAVPVTVIDEAVAQGKDWSLDAVIARDTWLEKPSIRAAYDSESDVLTLRLGHRDEPIVALDSDWENMFVGFDNIGETAWPTASAFSNVSKLIRDPNVLKSVGAQLYADFFLEWAWQAKDHPNEHIVIPLKTTDGEKLREIWSGITTVISGK